MPKKSLTSVVFLVYHITVYHFMKPVFYRAPGGAKTMRFIKDIFCVAVVIATVSPAFGDLALCDNPYTLFQLGNNGGVGGDKLEITSNSSVFGSTLKGVDNKPEKNKISTSKVTGSWDREKGVTNDFSSSWTGSQGTLSTPDFDAYATKAVEVSNYWAGQTGTNININLNSTTQTVDVSGGAPAGANIFTITDGFILNSSAKLTLIGDPGDFFVFNIPESHLFSIQSNSIIELGGDIQASEVLFNVLGNIPDAGPDDALIGGGSIFQGTLLAPGRKVEITQNHFYTFDSEGYMGTQAPETTAITALMAIDEKERNTSSWGGLWGQVIAGGAINFTESDIANDAFCPQQVPSPSSLILLSSGLIVSVIGLRKRRQL
ncbi:MAG: PEP-CTERM sorting domain-containing protein [Planctomycetes bacterium]|nr:PEP-CTERM sorting domain-containing protein [Planctomycetota bacterium]